MWRLAADVGLDVNSQYAYVVWGLHHRGTTIVAERRDELVGFVLGYVIPGTRDLFLWQVGVAREARATGLAGLMIDTLCCRVRPDAIEATVTPRNVASAALFRSFARRHGAPLSTARCLDASAFATEHEPEDLYRVELRDRQRRGTPIPQPGEDDLGAL
jgi:L-2,4-diaminobutyric acid acetyltransferase